MSEQELISRRRWLRPMAVVLGARVVHFVAFTSMPGWAKANVELKRNLHVGPARDLKTLREAAAIARDGDTILVDAGVYRGDVAVWRQKGLIIRAMGGGASLIANGASAEDKATFVFREADATVENIRFVGARSRDRNGAGIRLDVGSRLVVQGCIFEDNENGILTSNDAASELHVIDSQFFGNGAGDGQSHNLYVGTIGKLTVTGCYSARSKVGHLLKSRAKENLIAYSRLTGEDGTSSYELEFPSGGLAVVIGCLIQQGPKSENSAIVSYGAEGKNWGRNELNISYSTIVNDRKRGGAFVRVALRPARVDLQDNLLVGAGTLDLQSGNSQEVRNFEGAMSDFADPAKLDYRLRRSSRLIGAAGMAGHLQLGRMRPEREYVHPAGSVPLERFSAISSLSPGAFQRIAS